MDIESNLTPRQMAALVQPLHENRVKSRSVSGRNQSYVEAWDIKAMLIRIFGFGGFSSEVIESRILDIRDDGRQGSYPATHEKSGQPKTPFVMAYARVQLTIFGIGPGGQDAVYTEAAVGTNDGWTIGDVADNALKSAASDALKRCAINLGTQFGLSLYQNGSKDDVVKVLFGWQEALVAEGLANMVSGPDPSVQDALSRATSEPIGDYS